MSCITDNINKVFSLSIDNEILTTQLLNENYFYRPEITALLNMGIIARIEQDQYTIADLDGLYEYYLELKRAGLVTKAEQCHKKWELLKERATKIDENLKRIYDLYFDDKPLTKSNLLAIGIHPDDLAALTKQGILVKVDRELYSLSWFDDLKTYGKLLEFEGHLEKAARCFEHIHKMDTTTISEDMETIYNMIGEGKELKFSTLQEAGISSYRYSQYMKDGVLKHINGYRLTLTSSDGLYDYGKRLEESGDIEKAYVCYEKCCEISLNDDLCLKIFIHFTSTGQPKRGFAQLIKLRMSEQKSYRSLFYYFVFILSFVFKLPSEYKDLATRLKVNDMLTFENEHCHHSEKEDIALKTSIYNQQFSRAIALLTKREKSGIFTDVDALSKSLLIKIQKNQLVAKKAIIKAVSKRDSKGLMDVLSHEASLHMLSNDLYLLLLVAEEIERIQNSYVVPKSTFPKSLGIAELIRTKNYEKALHQSIKLAESEGKDPTKNLIVSILTWIVECQ